MNQETESRRGDKWCDDEGKEEQMEVKQEDGVWGRMSGGSEGGVWGGGGDDSAGLHRVFSVMV